MSRVLFPSAAAAAAVLLLGGCGSAGAPFGSGETVPATPLDGDAYAAAVKAAVGPLDAAFGALGKVTEHSRLTDGVTAVLAADERAVGSLQHIAAPTGMRTEHANLVGALRALRDDLNTMGEEVGRQAVCTGGAARDGLGRRGSATALRASVSALASKLPAAHLTWTVPAVPATDPPPPANGFLPRPGDRHGAGILKVDGTGTTEDTVVALARDGTPAFSVYVRKGQKAKVSKVNDGAYNVFLATGTAWDAAARGFGRDCAFSKFVNRVYFRTIEMFGTASSVWEITLRAGPTGNAPTEQTDANAFPG